ncbi:unnamed protein product [Vitrella brassicaformis CCMP3155]|uniref:Importin subunit alpha n=2 Tax=Vitrella brassicaformis TaxID=1169539 RepID=A0A0G4H3F8_VITBC|nr:unnamed protein product [Vitrella brassicaformis CCMP3155]|eukprot:CEM38238.1 unnamed protein product [Vitrella brassicaformis CCMP3155]
MTTPQLVKRLSGHLSFVKLSALRELHQRIEKDAQAAIDAIGDVSVLVGLLSSCCRSTATEAAKCLAAIAAAAADVVIDARQRAAPADALVETDAIDALVEADAISGLLQQLSWPDLAVRVYVASALCSIATSRRQRVVVGVSMTSLLGVMARGLNGGDAAIQLEAATAVRELFAIEGVPPIQEAVDAGVIQPLVGLLSDSGRPTLQGDAACALANIATGTSEQTQAIVDAGGIPPLIQLLSSPDGDVRHQAVCALGNIAVGGPAARDLVLAAGVMEPLLKVLRESKKVSMLRSASRTLANLCSRQPPPPFELVSPAVPVVAELIRRPDQDAKVLRQGCLALSHLTYEGPDEAIEAVVGSGVCSRLVELMGGHDSHTVRRHALCAFGKIVAGSEVHTQEMVDCGAIPSLKALLSSPRRNVRKGACFAIFNIMRGNRDQVQAVIDSGVVPQVIIMATTDVPSVQKGALSVIINGVGLGSQAQVEYLVGCGCVGPLCDLLVDGIEVAILGGALVAIHNFLCVGEQVQARDGLPHNPYCDVIEQADGQNRISQLTHHRDENIRNYSSAILATHWNIMVDIDSDTDAGSDGTDSTNTSSDETLSEDNVE